MGSYKLIWELARVDVPKLPTNNTNVLEHISVCLHEILNIMPSAALSDEVAQLQTENIVIMKGHNAVLKKMYLWFFVVADNLAIMRRILISVFNPAPRASAQKRRCKLYKENIYLSEIESAFPKDSS